MTRVPLISLAILSLALPALAAPPALGEILFKARELDGLKRVKKRIYFEGGKQSTLLVSHALTVHRGHIEVLSTEWKRSGRYERDGATINFGGSVRAITFAVRRDVDTGTVKGDQITFDKSGKQLTLPKGSVLVPLPLALFVLPSYYDLLPKTGLSFSTVVNKRLLNARLVVKEKRGELQLVEFQGPTGLKIGLYVSTAAKTLGQIKKLEVGGETVKSMPGTRASKLLKELSARLRAKAKTLTKPKASKATTPRAAVENLIKACAASDLNAVSACFSPKAPGEFQSLVKKTCPPKQFKQLCEMFKGAKITGVEEGKGTSTARVMVDLTKRKETLSMVKEGEEWRVLDF